MKVIQEPNETPLKMFSKFIESLKGENMTLRLHRFILVDEVDGGTLLYNSLTREIVLFEEGDDMFSEHFRDSLWLVPDEFEDTVLADVLKGELFGRRAKSITPRGYTIITTTDCNARCFYCYERNLLRKDMTEDTARDIVGYIEKNYLSDPEDKRREVKLAWFGGEPLFNKKVIDIICNGLAEKGIPYNSTMISNGYLFDEQTTNNAVLNWRLKHVQITLDGTEEYYNKAKNYIDKSVSPFKVVTDNIDRLLDSGVKIGVRINVGYYNIDDMKNLVGFIIERYKGKRGLSVYMHALFDSGGVTDIDTEEKRAVVYGEMERLEERLLRFGFGGGGNSVEPMKGTHCMADNGTHVGIQVDGSLCLCEHFVDSNQIGSIYGDELNQEVIDKFKEIEPPFEECYWCPIYPECSNLRICEDNERQCGGSRQAYKINRAKRAARVFYKNKIKSERNGENRKPARNEESGNESVGAQPEGTA